MNVSILKLSPNERKRLKLIVQQQSLKTKYFSCEAWMN